MRDARRSDERTGWGTRLATPLAIVAVLSLLLVWGTAATEPDFTILVENPGEQGEDVFLSFLDPDDGSVMKEETLHVPGVARPYSDHSATLPEPTTRIIQPWTDNRATVIQVTTASGGSGSYEVPDWCAACLVTIAVQPESVVFDMDRSEARTGFSTWF